MSPLVLLPAETDPVLEKRYGKRNPIRLYSSSNSKIVFTLLTEVIAVHVRLSAIYVRRTSFQLLLRRLKENGSWDGSGSASLCLQNGLKHLLQVIFGVFGDTNSSNRGVNNGGFCP